MIPGITQPPGLSGGNRPPNDIALTAIPGAGQTTNAKVKLSLTGDNTNTILFDDSQSVQRTGSQTGKARSASGVTAGKYYCEFSNDTGATQFQFGICTRDFQVGVSTANLGTSPDSVGIWDNGNVYRGNVVQYTLGAIGTQRVRMEYDADNRTVRFAVAGGAWGAAVDCSTFVSVGEEVFVSCGVTANTAKSRIYGASADWNYAAPSGAVPWPNGAPGLKGVGVIAAVDNGTSIAPAYPPSCGSIDAGDIIVIAALTDVNGSTINTPTGFTPVKTPQLAGTNTNSAMFWKRAVGGESGTITVTQTSAGAANDVFAASIDVFNGAYEGGDPIESAVNLFYGVVSSHTGLGVDVLGPQRLAVAYQITAAQALANDANDNWEPATFSGRWTAVAGDASTSMATQVSNAAGLPGWTESSGMGVSTDLHLWTFALKPRDEAQTYVQGMLVRSDTPVGAPIYTISGTDPDVGDTLTFSEVADPGNKFLISGNQLLLDGSLAAGTTLTTFNPSDKDVDLTLSGGDLTVTYSGGVASVSGVRATKSKTSGRHVFAINPGAGSTTMPDIGLVTASWPVAGGSLTANAELAVGINSAGQIFAGTGAAEATGGPTWTAGSSEVLLFVDLDQSYACYCVDGGAWFGTVSGADPDTGVGCLNFASQRPTGPLFPAVTIFWPGDNLTANFGASAFTKSLPSGASGWNTDPLGSYSITIRATDPGGLTYDEVFGITAFTASLRVTQEFLDVVYQQLPPTVRAGQEWLDVVYLKDDDKQVRVSQEFVDVIYDVPIDQWKFVGNATAAVTNAVTNVTVGIPANIAAGDLYVAMVGYRDPTTDATITLPAGWNLIVEEHAGTLGLCMAWSIYSVGMDRVFVKSDAGDVAIANAQAFRKMTTGGTIVLDDFDIAETASGLTTTVGGLTSTVGDELFVAAITSTYSSNSHYDNIAGDNLVITPNSVVEAGSPSGADIWGGMVNGKQSMIGTGGTITFTGLTTNARTLACALFKSI